MTPKNLFKASLLLSALLTGTLGMAQDIEAIQSEENASAELPRGMVALPVTPPLPGEEKLSARERAERDFLMPTRRKRAAPAAARAAPPSGAPHRSRPVAAPPAATRRRKAQY